MKNSSEKKPFDRLELLVGEERLLALRGASVIVFGVGGVGSWCAEGLVRSGIGKLTIVDSDVVCATNINRQLCATTKTIGEPKVDVMTARLKEINPNAEIIGMHKVYNAETKDEFDLGKYDYVIDAIDSLSSKVLLIMSAYDSGATIFSAFGAASKIDPTRVKVASIWKTENCKLGRFVRKRLRRRGFKGNLQCVYSDEEIYNAGIRADELCDDVLDDVCNDVCDNEVFNNKTDDNLPTNKTINGSFVGVTAVFGFTLASLVVKDIVEKCG